MLHVGLDLSRKRVDVCLISSEGELVEHFRAPADRDGLYGLSRRLAVHGEPVRGVVESMNGARLVHHGLVKHGSRLRRSRQPQPEAPPAAALHAKTGTGGLTPGSESQIRSEPDRERPQPRAVGATTLLPA